jgi:hypothetical protein
MKCGICDNLIQLLDDEESSSELVKEVVVILNALMMFFEIVFSTRNKKVVSKIETFRKSFKEASISSFVKVLEKLI